jgi:hypothetical protein
METTLSLPLGIQNLEFASYINSETVRKKEALHICKSYAIAATY